MAVLLLGAGGAFAADYPFAPNDVSTVFRIEKSENHNQVHYGIRLDSRCRPKGNAPVVPYWHMLERGSDHFEPLLRREERVYGIGAQEVELSSRGATVTMRLRSLESRPIRIEVQPTDTGCSARAFADVDGALARLDRIYVKTRLVRIGYVEVHGIRLADGEPVRERFRP